MSFFLILCIISSVINVGGIAIKKITDGIYTHRGYTIFNEEGEIWVENHLELFPTLIDAKEWINLRIDGTNKRIPKIIGEWKQK